MTETVRTFSGNNKPIKRLLPLIVILDVYNDVAIEHIRKNTGLRFEKSLYSMTAQPKTSKQIVKLFMTYDFKTQYHDNATNRNQLLLKSCNLDAFKISSVCFNCCKINNILTKGLARKERLSV